jgi:hypothetical protein
MTRVISIVLAILALSVGPIAAQEVLEGTWHLVSSKRTNTTTGTTTDSFGFNPLCYVMYSKDGRMMVLMTRSDRPKPDSIDKITNEQRSALFSSMLAYSVPINLMARPSNIPLICLGIRFGAERHRSGISPRREQ